MTTPTHTSLQANGTDGILDNESLRLAYSNFLTQEGHTVTTVARVEDALDYLATNTPNVLLLDMLLPKMNDMELLQQYDVVDARKDVKVIAFSNLTEPQIEQEAKDLDVKLYITKSLTIPKELVDTIQAVLAS